MADHPVLRGDLRNQGLAPPPRDRIQLALEVSPAYQSVCLCSQCYSLFYFGWLAWAIPSNLLMQRSPPAWYLAANIFMWGALLMCQAASKNFATLAALRVLSGAFEAIADPAFMLIISMFYTREEQPWRISIYYAFNGVGVAGGGLIGTSSGMTELMHRLRYWTHQRVARFMAIRVSDCGRIMLYMGNCAFHVPPELSGHFPRLLARGETHDDCSSQEESNGSRAQSDQMGSGQGDIYRLQVGLVLPARLLGQHRELSQAYSKLLLMCCSLMAASAT